jgi:hypothetical protein
MQARNEDTAHTRSLIMKILVRSWEYRHPRAWASVRAAGGIFVIFIGAILCSTGFW